MATPTLNSRPEKTINGFLSRWNAVSLPMIYSIANTKFPLNTEDSTESVTLIGDNGGFAQLTLSAPTSFVAKDFLTINAGAYLGKFQVRSVESTTLITISSPFLGNQNGTILKSYNNYATRIKIFVGIDSAHASTTTDPYTLIGTIDQIPDDGNNTLVDVRKFVQAKLNSTFQLSGNDLNAWKDLYIEFAEVYDQVISGVISEFESSFTSDIANFIHATYSSLQFGNSRGGNLYNFVAATAKSDLAQWITDFERPFILNYDDFSISIIINEGSNNFVLEIKNFDSNDQLLDTSSPPIDNEDYGVYRIQPIFGFINDNFTKYITIQLISGVLLSEVFRIDIDNKCIELWNWKDSDGVCVVDSDELPIVTQV